MELSGNRIVVYGTILGIASILVMAFGGGQSDRIDNSREILSEDIDLPTIQTTMLREEENHFQITEPELINYVNKGSVEYYRSDPTAKISKPTSSSQNNGGGGDTNGNNNQKGQNGNANSPDGSSNNQTKVDGSIQELMQKYSSEYQIPREWLSTVAVLSSNNNPNAVYHNADGSKDIGLMKINTRTAQLLAPGLGIVYSEQSLYDIEINIKYASYYLSTLMKQNPDLHYVFTAYRHGEWGALKIKRETGSYVSYFSLIAVQRTEGDE